MVGFATGLGMVLPVLGVQDRGSFIFDACNDTMFLDSGGHMIRRLLWVYSNFIRFLSWYWHTSGGVKASVGLYASAKYVVVVNIGHVFCAYIVNISISYFIAFQIKWSFDLFT
jgi:hypothetical protein